jgi:hypothetical protein
MGSKMRNRNFFAGSLAILWVLFAFLFFLDPVSASTNQQPRPGISRRAGTPGLGVELELDGIYIQPKKRISIEDEFKTKGAELTPVGFAGDAKINWKLTAETPGSTSPISVFPEAIIDGLRNKVGDHKTKSIGQAITKYFVSSFISYCC